MALVAYIENIFGRGREATVETVDWKKNILEPVSQLAL